MSKTSHPARSSSNTRQDGDDRASLEKQLADKKASIDERIDALEDEIVTAPAAIQESIRKHPLIGLGGALAAGLAVGLLVTRTRKPDVAPFHKRLVEQYVNAVGEDVRYRVRRGRSIEEAVHDSLRDRAPFIVYAPVREKERDTKGFFAQLGDIALKTALGFAVKTAIDLFTARLDVEELERLLALEERAADGAAESPSHVGDSAVDHPTETP